MIPEHNSIINVTNVRYKSKYAYVTCTIPNYMDVLKTIEIGQSITTNESFNLDLNGFSTQWKLIYFPKGQYDFGVASNNERMYVKMVSSDGSDKILRMSIMFQTQTSHSLCNSYPRKDASEFIPNHIKKSWAGPFEIAAIKDIKSKDSLTIKCCFEVIQFEDKNSKRTLSEVNYPILSNESKTVAKKNRSESPEVGSSKNITEKNSKRSGNERSSKFKYQNPSRSLKYFPDEPHALNEEYKADAEVSGYERLSKESQRLHRNLIFSPDERVEIKEKYNPRRSMSDRVTVRKKTEHIVTSFFNPRANCTPTSSRLSLQNQTEYIAPKIFKSSRCLRVSDIFSNAGTGKEDNQKEHQADPDEMNTTSVHEAVEHDQEQPLNKRISFFEGLSKGKE